MSDQTAGVSPVHIGEVAARTGLSLRTIRHYDEIGLAPPSGRTDGGFRLYTEADIQRLMLIRTLKPLGFSLEETGDLLAILDSLDGDDDDGARRVHARERLTAFVATAQQQRERLARDLALADELIAILRAR